MAIVFADGFDWYLTNDMPKRWTEAPSNWTVVTNPTRGNSIQAAWWTGANQVPPSRIIGTYTGEGIVGFAIYMPNAKTASRTRTFAIIDGVGNEQISIRTNASSQLTVTRSGTVLATGTTILTSLTWYYVEMRFLIHPSAGYVEVKLNGVSEIATTTGLNTRSTSTSQWTGIWIGQQNSAVSEGYFDDIYVIDATTGANTTFLGPIQVLVRYTSGNGSSADWSPNGGTNFGSVGELYQDGDATFNQSSTAGQTDTYTMQDAPNAAGSIFGVQVHTVAKQDAGVARTIAPIVRTGGTDYEGATVALSTSYQFLTRMWDQNPGTSSAWSVSDVNSLEIGYRLKS